MVEIGKFHTLRINRFVDFGAFVDAYDEDEILVPQKYMSGDEKEGDDIHVFVYLDSEERPVATTETPATEVNGYGIMEVNKVTEYGAFMDWGINKDLFVPYRNQNRTLKAGEKVVVYVYLDELTQRLVGTTKIKKYLPFEQSYTNGQEVEIIILKETNLGFEAIVNRDDIGMIYHNEIFQHIESGMEMKAYIKLVREDGKLDIALQKQGYDQVKSFADRLKEYIVNAGGFTPLTDKSAPEHIKEELGVSKKVFKKAVGKLYKEGIIVIDEKGISIKK